MVFLSCGPAPRASSRGKSRGRALEASPRAGLPEASKPGEILAEPLSNNHGASRQTQLGHNADCGVHLTMDSNTTPSSHVHRLVKTTSPALVSIGTVWSCGQIRGSCSLAGHCARAQTSMGAFSALLVCLEGVHGRAQLGELTQTLDLAPLEQTTYAQLMTSRISTAPFVRLNSRLQALADRAMPVNQGIATQH